MSLFTKITLVALFSTVTLVPTAAEAAAPTTTNAVVISEFSGSVGSLAG